MIEFDEMSERSLLIIRFFNWFVLERVGGVQANTFVRDLLMIFKIVLMTFKQIDNQNIGLLHTVFFLFRQFLIV